MRLLNTHSLEFGEFYDREIPPYAILSHRCGKEEVSYQDFIGQRKRDGAGFAKILKACELVISEGRKEGSTFSSWIWIDTCCINKESSHELSEAINSMWQWYQNAAVCYAYLDDVPDRPYATEESQNEASIAELMKSLRSFKSSFRQSAWFTRGWTLQELLAPRWVEFVSQTWTKIGDKVELCKYISKASGIRPAIIYNNVLGLSSCSVAEKLSWAAQRRTSRVEDMAYCLLGLLDVKMPLLYGEGSNAFTRLQAELVQSGDDESILAWFYDPSVGYTWRRGLHLWDDEALRGKPILSAESPSFFALCSNIQRATYIHRDPFSMTSRGLRASTILFPVVDRQHEFFMPLNCEIVVPTGQRDVWTVRMVNRFPLALHLSLVDPERNLYRREGCVSLTPTDLSELGHCLVDGKIVELYNITEHAVYAVTFSVLVLCPMIAMRVLWTWITFAIVVVCVFSFAIRPYSWRQKQKVIFIAKGGPRRYLNRLKKYGTV